MPLTSIQAVRRSVLSRESGRGELLDHGQLGLNEIILYYKTKLDTYLYILVQTHRTNTTKVTKGFCFIACFRYCLFFFLLAFVLNVYSQHRSLALCPGITFSGLRGSYWVPETGLQSATSKASILLQCLDLPMSFLKCVCEGRGRDQYWFICCNRYTASEKSIDKNRNM